MEHKSHPHHTLISDSSRDDVYTCADCRFVGLGPRYRCKEGCNFQVHECCMPSLRPSFIRVPLFKDKNCKFEFLDLPPGLGVDHRFCDACGTDVKGGVYHCYHCDRDLHPCCADLKDKMIGDVQFRLRKEPKSSCMMCNMKRLSKKKKTWWYVSEEEEFGLHVHCAIKLLLREGIAGGRGGGGLAIVKRIGEEKLVVDVKGKKKKTGWSATLKTATKIAEMVIAFVISVAIGNPSAFLVSLVSAAIRD
ncbi:hypothetical protein QJS10_CPB14g01530 [Acorus calamus]|uniref:Phorbol-ester/DAG-type domain-containing protein n=1 Tax=Acorus calamus TaxID=4465 RepID=A0AAV9DEF2_ACOCL|nr:hypothetical protein QJS10_CPB14g01530 [Acorus calamus]